MISIVRSLNMFWDISFGTLKKRGLHISLIGYKCKLCEQTVNTHLSYKTKVLSGVPQGLVFGPQGLVFGPLLFLIMIQVINEKIKHSILSSFADDTRMMKGIFSITDAVKLHQDLNNAQLNGDKFEHVSFGKDKELMKQSNYFTNTNTQIKEKESVKDLGFILCSDMT